MKPFLHKSFIFCSTLFFFTSGAVGQWVQQPFSPEDSLSRVRFVDPTNGWILGNSHIYKTSDGGNSWVSQDTSIGAGFALTALNRDTVFFADFTPNAPYTRGLRRTTNGGTVWTTVDTLSLLWNEVTFVNDTLGYAGGGTVPDYNPIVRKTTNGGVSWFTVWTGTGNYEVEGMHFMNADHGWMVLYDAVVLETTDGGMNWNVSDSVRFPNGSFLPLRDITFAGNDSGWAVGGIAGTSIIVRTTDAGLHWEVQTFPGSSLREVTFFGASLGWIVGANSGEPFIARTTDGGSTWVTQNLQPASIRGVESFFMINPDLGWAVNGENMLYKTTNGGLISGARLMKDLPNEFSLYQNYPNPFNPTTTIRFSLSRRSHVSLTVMNILGQEVATLVSGKREAGTYWAIWNADNVASGVYFYRLVADDFVAVNRMILLK